MRFNNPVSGRPEYYDRTPLTVTQDYTNLGLAPAVLTNRWTYTVPTNRKSFITALNCWTSRVTVAAPVGIVQAELNYGKAAGGGGNTIGMAWISNNIGDSRNSQVGSSAVMLAGDSMTGQTGDASTGGTVAFQVSGTFTEYDV